VLPQQLLLRLPLHLHLLLLQHLPPRQKQHQKRRKQKHLLPRKKQQQLRHQQQLSNIAVSEVHNEGSDELPFFSSMHIILAFATSSRFTIVSVLLMSVFSFLSANKCVTYVSHNQRERTWCL
jgi:hypothetical protein